MSFGRRLFSDKTFLAAYLKCLNRISKETYLEGMLRSLKGEIKDNNRLLNGNDATLRELVASLASNKRVIVQSLHPLKGIHAYVDVGAKEDRLTFYVANAQHWPISLHGLMLGQTLVADLNSNELEGKDPKQPVTFHQIDIEKQIGSKNASSLTVTYSIPGLDKIYETKVFPWNPGIKVEPEKSVATIDPLRGFTNVLSIQGNRILIHRGKHVLKRNIVVPVGYTLVIPPRTTILLKDGASIVSYSPVDIHGTADEPVKITSEDHTGGLAVVGTGKLGSTMEYVIFDGLRNPTGLQNEFTGAVTFYESPVEINHCSFFRNQSEDALNIVRSTFSVNNSRFFDTMSDALDLDFCSGDISNSTFANCGNDAVDLSGSNVKLTGLNITNAGDKGISIGENSRSSLKDTSIDNAKIGLASKDMSTLYVSDCKIDNCRVGVAVYQKKPEYYGSNLIVSQLAMTNNDTPCLVEKGSVLIVDNKRIPAVKQKLVKLLYGEEFMPEKSQ